MKPGAEHERLSAYLDDALTATERTEFEQLLADRPDLQTLAEEWRRLRVALRALPPKQLSSAFSEQVLAAAERRMLRGPDPTVMRAARTKRRYAWAGVAVVAAAVLLVMFAIPRGARRVARQNRPHVQLPSSAASRVPSDAEKNGNTPAERMMFADESEIADAAEETDAHERPMASRGIATATTPTYDFTVVISPQNAAQLGELRRLLQDPSVEMVLADTAETADKFRREGVREDLARDRQQSTARGGSGGVASRAPAMELTAEPAGSLPDAPADVYLAIGPAAEIQSLLNTLQSAGIPAAQQDKFDLRQLLASPEALAGTATRGSAVTGQDGMAVDSDMRLAEHSPQRQEARQTAGSEKRQGLQLQFLGQVAVAPSQLALEPYTQAGRDQAPLPENEAAGPNQQVLIVIQNPTAAEETGNH